MCVREKEWESEGVIETGDRDYVFHVLTDLRGALCHVVKLCFRPRRFVWVITAALAAKPSSRI